jgi:hypothetical protein
LSDAEQDYVITALEGVSRRIDHHSATRISERMMRV